MNPVLLLYTVIVWDGSVIGYTRSARTCTLELISRCSCSYGNEIRGFVYVASSSIIVNCCMENYVEG